MQKRERILPANKERHAESSKAFFYNVTCVMDEQFTSKAETGTNGEDRFAERKTKKRKKRNFPTNERRHRKKKQSFTSDDDIATYFQLQKMKRFLGTRDSGVCDDESGPISYGDGHSGWNR